MRVTIEIDTDNDAFYVGFGPDEETYAPEAEVSRILRQLADGIGQTVDLAVGESHPLRDINGNRVGQVEAPYFEPEDYVEIRPAHVALLECFLESVGEPGLGDYEPED